MAEKQTRKRRTKEEMVKAVDEKIAAENKRHEEAIKKLNEEKERLKGTTLTKAQRQKRVIDAIKKSDLSPEEVVRKLGLKVDFERPTA